jgi:RNA polymerase sigma-70 factor (ECF subfamily)
MKDMDSRSDFSLIYRQHAEAVFRLAFLLTGQRAEAEDLTSETFARALASAGAIRHETVRSYLYAITRNLVASRQRRPALELADPDEAYAQAAHDPDPGPEERLEIRQRLAHAGAGLAAMKERDRQVLLLCGLDGLDPTQIAEALGLEPGAVRVRLHRARRQLAAWLQPIRINPKGEPA